MNTVTIGVSTLEETKQRLAEALRGKPQGSRISFTTPELLWKTLSEARVKMLFTMAGKGPVSLRAVARLVGRDVKTVHGDVHLLLRSGILEKTEAGKIVFPYDAIHVDFMIHGVAA